MSLHFSDVWTWHGRVGRAKYVVIGALLFAIKHNFDRIIAAAFGHPWSIFNYWIFESSSIDSVSPQVARFYAVLVTAALPFIYVGVVLTVRRLRDAGLPLWLVLCFFLPFLNLFFFLLLSFVPSATERESISPRERYYSKLRRAVPENEFSSAALGIIATTALCVLVAIFSSEGLARYGWGMFIGIPFFLGLNSVLIYGIPRARSLGRCMLVAVLSVALAGLLLFALAIEGVICLAMALPLGIVIALFGGFIGFVLQQRSSTTTFRVVSLVFVVTPLFVLLENSMPAVAPLHEVKTSIVVNAKPQNVWNHIVTFSEISTPTETLFRTGIAYPTHARIDGNGVDAIRHCVFSTGEFTEPITRWDEPQLLQFDVSSQPPVMHELSWYNELQPPHLENYFISRKGQFLLTALPDGSTRLEGTTWYQNRFWPSAYWHWWSDYIVHRIHTRVLLHIKHLSEAQ